MGSIEGSIGEERTKIRRRSIKMRKLKGGNGMRGERQRGGAAEGGSLHLKELKYIVLSMG